MPEMLESNNRCKYYEDEGIPGKNVKFRMAKEIVGQDDSMSPS